MIKGLIKKWLGITALEVQIKSLEEKYKRMDFLNEMYTKDFQHFLDKGYEERESFLKQAEEVRIGLLDVNSDLSHENYKLRKAYTSFLVRANRQLKAIGINPQIAKPKKVVKKAPIKKSGKPQTATKKGVKPNGK